MTIVGFCRSGCWTSFPAKHAMVMLFPEPWVCHTMPPFREPGVTRLPHVARGARTSIAETPGFEAAITVARTASRTA